jgi:20S proteasome alpha/beta subunit
MACDSQETAGDVIVGQRTKKMWKLADGTIVGCAGKVAQVQKFMDWFREEDDSPAPKGLNDMTALILYPDGVVEQFEDGVRMPSARIAAIGTGHISALTAMDLGFSPAEAVKAACKRDVFSSPPIQVLSL